MQKASNTQHQFNQRLCIALTLGFFLLPKVAIALQPASNLDDTDHGGTDWIISASTVIAGKQINLKTFTINSGVTVTVWPSTVTAGPWNNGDIGRYGKVEIHADSVAINGLLTADGSGFLGGAGGNGYGPGGGGQISGSFCYSAAGGGYGAKGGNGTVAQGGSPYSDIYSTGTFIGSGGGGGSGVSEMGGNGGGAIYIQANYILLNGTVTAAGSSAQTPTRSIGSGGLGGGSGGTVSLISSSFTYASGQVKANGGNGSGNFSGTNCGSYFESGGSGSGGRIQVLILANGTLPSSAVSVIGQNNGTLFYLADPTLNNPNWAASDVGVTSITTRWKIDISSAPQKYHIEFSTSADFSVVTASETFNLFVSSGGLTPSTSYFSRVASIHPSTPSIMSSFVVSNPTVTLPAAPLLNSPNWSSLDLWTTSVTARWNANGNPQTVRYRVDFSTSANFAGMLTSSETYSLSFSSISLTPNTTVAFRVQAIGINDYRTQFVTGVATSTLSVDPALIQPMPSDVFVASVTARWNTNGNSSQTKYRVQFATSATFSGVITTSDTFSFSATTVSLIPNTTIAIRVQSINNNNVPSQFSNISTTMSLSAMPLLNNSHWSNGDVNTSPQLAEWNANGNPSGTTFRVQFATSSDFTSPGITITPGSGGSEYTTSLFIATGTPRNWLLAFRVQSINGANVPSNWVTSVTTASLCDPPGIVSFNVLETSVSVKLDQGQFGLNQPGTTLAVSTGDFSVSNSSIGTQGIGNTILNMMNISTSWAVNSTYTVNALARNFFNRPTSSVLVVSSATKANVPDQATISSFIYATSFTVCFAWDAGAYNFNDGNPIQGTTYQIQVTTVSNFNSGMIFSTSIVTSPSGARCMWFTGLTPITFYYPRSQAINKMGVPTAWNAPGTPRKTMPAQPVLNAPNWASADVGITSVTARWTANGNPSGTTYQVQFATSPDFSGAVTQFTTTGISISTSVTPNWPILFRVLATDGSNSSSYAVSAATNTFVYTPTLNNPNWATEDVGNKSVIARWNSNGNPPETFYDVSFATNSDAQGYLIKDTSYTYNLQAGNETIAFKVRAKDAGGKLTNWAVSVTTVTLSATPGTVNYQVFTTSISATLSTNGNDVGTVIAITTGSGSGEFDPTNSSSSVQQTFTYKGGGVYGGEDITLSLASLTPNSAYTVKARAVNSNNLSSASSIVASTSTLTAVHVVTGFKVFATSAAFFIGSNGNPNGTQVVISTGINGNYAVNLSTIGIISGDNTMLYLTGLTPNTTYGFQSGSLNPTGSTNTVMVTISTRTMTAMHAIAGFQVFTTSVSITIDANNNPPGTKIFVATGTDGYFAVQNSSIGVVTAANTQLSIINLSTNTFYGLQSGSLNPDGSTNPVSVTLSTCTLAVQPNLMGFKLFVTSASVTLGPASNPKGTYLEISTMSSFTASASSRVTTTETCVWNPVTEQFDCTLDAMTVSIFNLTPNTDYVLRARALNRTQSPTQSFPISSTATFAAVPGTVDFSDVSFTSVTIFWSNNGNSLTPSTSYEVLISTWNGFAGVVTSSITFSLSASTEGLISGETYFFRVRAFNRRGGSSEYTNFVSTITQSRIPLPDSFSSNQVGISSIAFSWSANGNPQGTLYRTQVSADPTFTSPSAVETTELSISSSNLFPNTTYYFRVAASPFANYSNALATTTLSVSPSINSVTSSTDSVSVTIARTGNPLGTMVRVTVSSDPASVDFSSSGVITGDLTTLLVSGLSPNTTYCIGSKSINYQFLVSSRTETSTATLANLPGAIVFSEVNLTSITVSWSANGNPLALPTSYQVDISQFEDFSSFTSSITFVLSVTTQGLISNATYYFRVKAFNRRGVPTDVVTANAFTGARLLMISGFQVFTSSVTGFINRNGNLIGSAIALSTGTDGNFTVALASSGVISGDITPLTVTGLSTNTAYSFQAGVVSGGQAVNKTNITLSTYTASVPPSLAAFSATDNSISLTLNLNTNPSGTTLQTSTGDFQTGMISNGTPASFSNLMPKTSYTVKGRSVNQTGQPSESVVLFSTYTKSAVPTNLSAKATLTSLTFNWDKNGNPAGTNYFVQLNLGTNSDLVGSQTLNTTQAVFSGLSLGTNYTLRLYALNQDGTKGSEVSLSAATKQSTPPNPIVFVTTGSYILSWQTQPDASGYRVKDAANTLIAELSSSAISHSQSGFGENQKITRKIEYFDQFITTTIIDMTFYTAVSPPKSTAEVMTILERTATTMRIRVVPPPNPTGKAGVRIRFIPVGTGASSSYQEYLASYKYPEGVAKYQGTAQSFFYAPDPPGTIVADFSDGQWEKTVTGLSPGVRYSISVSYLNSDGIESPVGASAMDLFVGFSAGEEGIKPEKETFFINQGVNFLVTSNRSGSGTIKIYGVNQNLVRTIAFTFGSGYNNVKWDGNDDNGQPVYTDVYWVVIESSNFEKKTINVAAIR